MEEQQKKIDALIARTFTDLDAICYLCEFVSLLVVIYASIQILFVGLSMFYVFMFLFGLLFIKGARHMINYCDRSLKTMSIVSDVYIKMNKEVNDDKSNKD